MHMDLPRIPFTILALAPFSEVSEDSFSPEIIGASLDTLDNAIDSLASTLFIPVSKDLCPAGILPFKPSGIKDFRPQAMVKNIPYLKSLLDAKEFIEQAGLKGLSDEQIVRLLQEDWPDLPLDLTIAPGEASSQPEESSAVDDLLAMVAVPGGTGAEARSGKGGARAWKGQVGSLMAKLLEIIFADETFRLTEASWKGVETLVRQGPVKQEEGIALNICPISRDVLPAAMDSLISSLADDMPNLILIDLPFDNSTPSMELLKKIADFAATLLVPTAVWIGPRFFHIQNWNELKKLPYLKHYLEDAAYAKWRKLKEHPGSEWLVMTTNRFIIREPYGEGNPSRTVFFEENEPLWISPVWALGTLMAKSVVKYGWPTRFTDYRNIALSNLAVGPFGGKESASTETVFSEERIMQFVESNITVLAGALRKDSAFIPKEATLSGASLKFQLFFNRIIGYLFSLKDEMGKSAGDADLGARLEAALAELFRHTGHEPPADISVHAEQAEPGERIPLRIAFTPPGSILPTSERLEFSLAW